MPYTVPALPYAYDALEPHIDVETMTLHHDKHHQAYVDSMFWETMSPDGGGEPSGELADAIGREFGSFDDFKEQFEAAGVGQFGSGWAWLVSDGGKLAVTSTPNQDNPVSAGKTPLLGNDVWEHAYYLTYRNRRPDYLRAGWNTVDWNRVGERHAAVTASRVPAAI